MYIVVDDQLVLEEYNTPEFQNCIRKLMLAYQEGLHIVEISPSSVKKIIDIGCFTGTTYALLRHYYNHLCRQVSALRSSFTKIFIITISSNNTICYTDLNSRIEYYFLNTSAINSSKNVQETVLLGEHITDAKIFKCFASYYLDLKSLSKHVLVKCEVTHGGGDTTSDVYGEYFSKNEKFCLCILDSDQKFPSCKFGQTAKKVAKFQQDNTLENSRSQYYILENFLELENLLPDSFYDAQYGDDVNKSNIMPTLNQMSSLDRKYIDMKKGIFCKKMQDENAYACYWRDKLDIIRRIDCPKDNGGNYACNHQIVKGYGTKILTHFLEYCEVTDITPVVKTSRNEIKCSWHDVGLLVASFCCGHAPVIAV